MKRAKVSVILPAYNVEDKILSCVSRVLKTINDLHYEPEVVVVNDGSSDKTGEKVRSVYASDPRVKLVENPENQGKGYAVKEGFYHSSGDYVIFMDSDLEIKPEQLKTYLEPLEKADIIIGSKHHPKSQVIYPYIRRFFSGAYKVLALAMTGLRCTDTQCGLKSFRREALEKILPLLVIKTYSFDVELLVVAHHLGCKVLEAPVEIEMQDSFGNILDFSKAVFRMFIELLSISYRLHYKKWYDRKIEERLLMEKVDPY